MQNSGHSDTPTPRASGPDFSCFCAFLGCSHRPHVWKGRVATPPLDILRDNRSVRPLPAGTTGRPISAPIRARAVIHTRNSGYRSWARATRSRARCTVVVAMSECPESLSCLQDTWS